MGSWSQRFGTRVELNARRGSGAAGFEADSQPFPYCLRTRDFCQDRIERSMIVGRQCPYSLCGSPQTRSPTFSPVVAWAAESRCRGRRLISRSWVQPPLKAGDSRGERILLAYEKACAIGGVGAQGDRPGARAARGMRRRAPSASPGRRSAPPQDPERGRSGIGLGRVRPRLPAATSCCTARRSRWWRTRRTARRDPTRPAAFPFPWRVQLARASWLRIRGRSLPTRTCRPRPLPRAAAPGAGGAARFRRGGRGQRARRGAGSPPLGPAARAGSPGTAGQTRGEHVSSRQMGRGDHRQGRWDVPPAARIDCRME
jgi:hypothetical protein